MSLCSGMVFVRARRESAGWARVAFLVVALLVAASSVWSCLSRSCTSAGCQSGISARVVGALQGASLARLCLDGNCVEATWPLSEPDCTAGSEPPLALSVCLDEDGAFVRLTLEPGVKPDNGAHLEFVVQDASGGALLLETEEVMFTDSYPNGRECPGHCRYANFRY